ncbi:hypothetical protein [Carboxydothermus ferrireducens]|uniref:Uncharacterized protein n=1 Tax=Carboxydothermus ferrireducens DSM 11255 TaxID=1119529 RepID=A0ABX2R7Y1_9THEO|nr:hypothetical protein [Carboxydothermus ferrireducens]NYE57165.1 hypothetical protein [Carboxydothermus ferrireducens DSM 11255]
MTKKLKKISIRLSDNHKIFTYPPRTRSAILREWIEAGIELSEIKNEINEIKATINAIYSLLTQEGTNSPPKIKLSELNNPAKTEEKDEKLENLKTMLNFFDDFEG